METGKIIISANIEKDKVFNISDEYASIVGLSDKDK